MPRASFRLGYIVCTLLFLLTTSQLFAQFSDDFSDGDYTASPQWTGHDSKFAVIAEQLALQAPAVADVAYLTSPSAAINNATWQFFVKLDFNPSGSNYTRIYLSSDNPDITQALNGYYVLLGGTPDEVSLFSQTGTVHTKVIDGADGSLSLSTVRVRVRVTRDDSGNWELFTDVGNTGSFTSEGVANDTKHLSSAYFGVYCLYSATRSDKFSFDDFVISGDPYQDSEPPSPTGIKILSSHELEVKFSELLSETSAEDLNNYSLDHGIGNPMDATLQADGLTVHLTFNTDFPNAVDCKLSLAGVLDINGNAMIPVMLDFFYFKPAVANEKDIIITEIFSDPSPSIGLPEAEFVELFNRSSDAFDMSQWKIGDGTSFGVLSSLILLPSEHCIITANSSVGQFSSFGKVSGVSTFPALNNSGDPVILSSPDGSIIDSVFYRDTWYRSEDKKQGGWSLELIDPQNTCGEEENWTASEADAGGTPGKQNSVFANKPDLTGPRLLSVTPFSPKTVRLKFDEKLDESLPTPENFELGPSGTVLDVSFVDGSLREIELLLANALDVGITYTVTAKVYDCAGNTIQIGFDQLVFGVPEPAVPMDIVINEVLFNPRSGGVDFVEIFNVSRKFINLNEWKIAKGSEEQIKIASGDLLFPPKAILALTSNSITLENHYPKSRKENLLEVNLPNYADDTGIIIIHNNEADTIDMFIYTEKMHSSFLKDNNGVSLERISGSDITQNEGNWKSASSVAGFATPGYENSNTLPSNFMSDASVSVYPEIFVPVNGQPDFTSIVYNFDHGGYVGNIKIFDVRGRLIKEIADNEILGQSGFFRWDGDNDQGGKARMGYYVVWFEVFDDSGVVKTFRKRVIIASSFN